jgi:Bacterial PH domain
MSAVRTFRPGGARIVVYVVAVLMLVFTAVIGFALPSSASFTWAENLTLAVVILAVLVLLHGIGRSYVRVDDDGVRVLNGYRSYDVPWTKIEGFAMNNGAPWPTMVTTDDERIILFAIQGTDGPYAREAMAHLRGRLQ